MAPNSTPWLADGSGRSGAHPAGVLGVWTDAFQPRTTQHTIARKSRIGRRSHACRPYPSMLRMSSGHHEQPADGQSLHGLPYRRAPADRGRRLSARSYRECPHVPGLPHRTSRLRGTAHGHCAHRSRPHRFSANRWPRENSLRVLSQGQRFQRDAPIMRFLPC